MHLSYYALDVLLRVPSQKWVVAVSVKVCVVHIRSNLEGTEEGAHTPQLVVVHRVLPLSSLLFVYPDLSSTNYALSCVHAQQIMLFLIDPFIV